MRIPPYFLLLLLVLFGVNALKAQDSSYPFVENAGQWEAPILAKIEAGEGNLFLESNAFHYQFVHFPDKHGGHEHDAADSLVLGHTFRAEFVAANPNPAISFAQSSSFYHNYYLGKKESRWKSKVRAYQEIEYTDLYDGIDLVAYAHQGAIKYDYLIAPGADPNQIQIRYRGEVQPEIRNGEIHIKHRLGELIEERPIAYQLHAGQKTIVACDFVLNEKGYVSFNFPEGYTDSLPLIIDPVLIFSTYSGSTSVNFGMTATYDNAGNGYMGGVNFATGYDTTLGAFQRVYNGGPSDIVISKFNPDGTQLLFSTYLGGNSSETVHSMVVDDSLNLIILGVSSSANYPITASAFDTVKTNSQTINISILAQSFVSGPDLVISKFNETGTQLKGSTFFGGSSSDGLNINLASTNSANLNLVYNYGDQFRGEVIVDSSGSIYIGTTTHSDSLDSFGDSLSGDQDGIVAKFSSDLSNRVWSKYVGGSSNDAIYSLKIINGNRVLVGGGTQSFSDFPVSSNAYQSSSLQGRSDGFISIISSDGQFIEKSSFISTDNYDQVYFVEFDRFGGIYAFGQSFGGKMPLKNTKIADTLAGQFIVKLDNNLDSLIYATTFGDGLVGGAINISPTAFLVDQCQNVYISGWGAGIVPNEGSKTLTTNMPLTANAFRNTINQTDFYLYVMKRDADSILYGSFFGGTSSRDHVDGGTSRFDKRGVIYQSVCASCGPNNGDFPTTPGAHARVNPVTTGNNCNNALFKFDFEILPRASIFTSTEVVCAPSFVTIKDSSKNAEELLWDFYGTPSLTQNLDTVIYFDTPGFYTIRQYARDTICNTIDSTEIIIEVQPSTIAYTPTADVITCDQSQVQLSANHFGTASEIHWSSNPQFSDTLNAGGDSSFSLLPISIPREYYLRLGNPGSLCEVLDTVTVLYIPLSANSFVDEDTICEGVPVQFLSSFLNATEFRWEFGDNTIDTSNLNPFKTYINPGDYTILSIVSNDQCAERDTNTLQLNVRFNSLQIEPISDTIYCGLDSLQFKINSFGTANDFLWSSNSVYSDTLNSFPDDSLLAIFDNTNQNYYKKVSDQFCERTSIVNIQYIRYQSQLLAVPDSLCAPAGVQINTLQEGITSFRIDFGNGQFTSTDPNPFTNYPDTGNFIIQFASQNNLCPRSDTAYDTIRIEPAVQVAPFIDTTVCLGDTVQLLGSSLGTANRFIWSESPDFSNPLNNTTDSTARVSPAAPGLLYYFKATRTICSDSSFKQVNVEEVNVFLEEVISICYNDSIQIEAINLGANPLSYIWAPNDSILLGQSSNQILVSPKQDLIYTLNSTSAIGCNDMDSILVQVFQPAFIDAEINASSDSIYRGQQVRLSTNRNGSNLSYIWEPAAGLSNANSANPIASPQQSTLYKVSIYDEATGCVVTAYRLINVYEINCGEPDIFIPTAFTPNGDGSNDLLYVRGNNLSSIDLQIFNRWGELVFQTTDQNQAWDGSYKGKAADPGVFAFQLQATCFDGQNFSKKGNITIIR